MSKYDIDILDEETRLYIEESGITPEELMSSRLPNKEDLITQCNIIQAQYNGHLMVVGFNGNNVVFVINELTPVL